MRSSAWSSLATSACSALALVLAAPAAAHIEAVPGFLDADGGGVVSLTAHNDRRVTMTEFAVTVPAGLRIEEAGEITGWSASTDGQVATWAGGSLAPEQPETFDLVLDASGEPGTVSLQAVQRYPDGESLEWPIALTLVPADEASGDVWVYAVVGAGFLLAAAGLALAWRRRERGATPQG
jgi:MYXO-CTERM domain-containing protein